MPVFSDLREFAGRLPAFGCLIGVDHGSKSVGIAASDHERRIASPILTIKEKKFRARADRILAVCRDRSAAGIVLGLPLNMDGTQGPQCQSVRAFAFNLKLLTELPMTFWDERLSSNEANQSVTDLGMKKRRRSEAVHRIAAAMMLQWAMDEISRHEAPR